MAFNGSSWKPMYDNIKRMRAYISAPVDTKGCHKCADEDSSPKIKRYQNLISLLLSSQTKDDITYAAMSRLKDFGLEPNNIIKTDKKVIEQLIYPVGFYKKKAESLIKVSRILLETYDGDIPRNVDELMKLPGIGQKMAYICMNVAWGEVVGIGVDTHVHRISQRLGWIEKTKDPNQTRLQLEKIIPKQLWSEINPLLVGFGQQICLPTNPHCDKCLNNEICPKLFISKKNSVVRKRKSIKNNV